MIQKGFK